MNSVPVFWALALALIALTLLVLLWPLLGPRRAREPSEAAARAAIYRDQKRQLDDDQAAGVITPAEHEAGVAELTRRLGLELDTSPEATAQAPQRSGWIAALVAVAVIPVGAIVVYLALGSPEALRPQAANEARPNEQQIVAMVETLAARMKANPSDPKGWRLLGRSFAALGRYAEAADAYEQASQHGDDDADLFADWAEALAMAHNRTIAGEPEALARKALARDAGNVKAMALLATAAFERRDFDQSIDFWRRVQARFPPGSEDAKQAAAAVAEVERARQQAGTPAPSPPAANAQGTRPQAAQSAQGSASTRSGATAGPAFAVSGRVEVAPALAPRIQPDDTLFVFARAEHGPRMPLAVLRARASALPLDFTLDDSMSMAGGTRLSAAGTIVVEARISRSGNALPRSGDLAGTSTPVEPGAHDVRIVIGQVVP